MPNTPDQQRLIDQAERDFYEGLLAANTAYRQSMDTLMFNHAQAMQQIKLLENLDPSIDMPIQSVVELELPEQDTPKE